MTNTRALILLVVILFYGAEASSFRTTILQSLTSMVLPDVLQEPVDMLIEAPALACVPLIGLEQWNPQTFYHAAKLVKRIVSDDDVFGVLMPPIDNATLRVSTKNHLAEGFAYETLVITEATKSMCHHAVRDLSEEQVARFKYLLFKRLMGLAQHGRDAVREKRALGP